MRKPFCQEENLLIRRNFRSRTIRLSVNRKGVFVLNVPFLCPQKVIRAFLEKNQTWIEEQKKKQQQNLTFTDGQSVCVLGQTLCIRHYPDRHFPTHIQDSFLLVSGDISFLNRRVCDFIKKQTEHYIQAKAPLLAQKINHKINRICLKDTTSRWGSCSGKGNLNFCWRLGMAPLFVLDYIIAHEVSHLKEMNHGPRFWNTVSMLCDCRSDAEIWLRRHGHTLR